MGIDLLEIVFRIEKRFAISVRGDARGAFQTAGTLSEYLWQRLQGIQPGIPDVTELSKQVDDALPAAPVRRWWSRRVSFEARIAHGDLEDNWRRFQRSLGLALPQVVYCEGTNQWRLPFGFRTNASVVLWMIQNHPERVMWVRKPSTTDRPPGAEAVTREECWLAVRDILAEVLAVEPEQVVPEAHLIEDLGMG